MSEPDPIDDPRSDPDIPAGIHYDPDLAVHEPMGVPEGVQPPSRRRSPILIFVLALPFLSLVIYLMFGVIARESKSSADYLNEIRLGHGGAWEAAFELSRLLPAEDKTRRGARFVADLVREFARARHEDPRLRRYLALCLGELRDPLAVDALVASLDDPDPDARLYAAWALGAIGDRRAAPALVPLLESEEAGLRKVAAYALGAMEAPAADAPLRGLLNDPVEEVAWNAALALARLGDPAGLPLLVRLLDRSYLASRAGLDEAGRSRPMTEESKEDAMVNALRALARLRDRDHLPAVRALRDLDPSLKVRDAARAALEAVDGRY